MIMRIPGLPLYILLMCFSFNAHSLGKLEFRVEDSPYLDLTWNLVRAILTRNHEDYSLFYQKALTYRAGYDYPDLKSAQNFRRDVSLALLDSADKRSDYFKAKGRKFSSKLHARTQRSLVYQYRYLSLGIRVELVGMLTDSYASLLQGDSQAYQAKLEDVQDFLLANKVIADPAEGIAVDSLKQELAAIVERGIGAYLHRPIQADFVDCSPYEGQSYSMPFQRLVLDPGHFGGDGVQDSREYKGYREGRATFIVAQLTKFILVKCLSIEGSRIILSRDDLRSIYGNGNVSIRNMSLMDYRAELIAFLEPDAVISIHTNAGMQQIYTFSPSLKPVYYQYRSRQDLVPSLETHRLSSEFSEIMAAGLERELGQTDGNLSRKQLLGLDSETLVKQGLSKVFQNIMDRNIPLVLLEGISHESDQMITLLTQPEHQIEHVVLGGTEYRYHPILRWYAEGIVRGLLNYGARKNSD